MSVPLGNERRWGVAGMQRDKAPVEWPRSEGGEPSPEKIEGCEQFSPEKDIRRTTKRTPEVNMFIFVHGPEYNGLFQMYLDNVNSWTNYVCMYAYLIGHSRLGLFRTNINTDKYIFKWK